MITFTKNISTSQLLYAYNNNIVEFNADLGGIAPAYCDIIINGVLAATIYPVGNKFWYNFKEVVSTLINRNSFQDLTNTVIVPDDVNEFTFNETASKFLTVGVNYSVRFVNGQTSIDTKKHSFVRGVRQNKKDIKIQPYTFLTPQQPEIDLTDINYIKPYVKYWQGFPFDLTYFTEIDPDADPNPDPDIFVPEVPSDFILRITNNTNQLLDDFSVKGQIGRLLFSDGRTDQTIELRLPLVAGINELQVGISDFQIDVDKILDGCGIYIKWLNPQGGWSYWLFTDFYQENKSTRSLGQINNDYKDIDDTTSPNYSLGKTEQNRLSVTSDIIHQRANTLLKTLFASPKVYLFTGKQFSQNTFNDWLAVEINNNKVTTKNYKNDFVQYEVEIVMPELNTLTL